MASTDPLCIHDDDDDDEFDWEAAVKEIDVACQNTSKPPPFSSNSHQKQSTLDKFFPAPVKSSTLLRPQNSNAGEGGDVDSGFVEVEIDAEAAKMWIYPVNVPLRDYQLSITQTALFANTLVALPTGLGKTLIAAVVIYNYFRWFPTGKIVFAAPSRPLVMQQIEACHNVVGIPQEWTIDMTGQTSPAKRALFWKTKRVFFVTPQVLEKDIQSGSCMVKHLVCLVIDEAHRALGNYSYCTVVRELMAVPVTLRILALSATPGSKQQTVQQIIDNLCISSLEYRNETDQDVIPYVHDRKIELIQVAMGEDAVEINNLLWEVIRPFVFWLCSIGALQNRDYQMLSPCDLLNSRDKFRQAPPPDIPHVKYGEVEGCFGVLITLYHIRKLLSGHGIRPAFEMLEEKLQQGSFARLMSKNEVLWKAKLLMQQSLSHGAPSPKLSKMIEVLIDHFKTKDPENSRVIIFSNFRGSVRDIMSALANIGGAVKPTQFIGQSSGKTLKGQSQKVQQAVLEKFRAGGYNVIVATSIGEEGLDIMEVDLVICFDANISPLRMIQRMGRTGRKHEGRVVVLACEGSELKGYMRKQANSKAIKKHMRNGGLNSFNFHPSPRMFFTAQIPHILKPEVKFVELSIEQFILRGKKTRDDDHTELPLFKTKLIETEKALIAKYFHPTVKSTWRPSLIVFPHFQALPSTVHKVMHSFRTGMLIDAMQQLQGFSFSRSEVSFNEDKSCSDTCFRAETAEQHDNNVAEETWREVSELDVLPVRTSRTNDNQHMDDVQGQNAVHSFLFGSDFISVDAFGRVLISSIPAFYSTVSHCKCTNINSTMLVSCSKNDPYHCTPLHEEDKETMEKMMDVSAIQIKCTGNETLPDTRHEDQFTVHERIRQTSISKRILSYEEDNTGETDNLVDSKTPMLLVNESSDMPGDVELSPRLTNFIESGIVPESPVPHRVAIREAREGDLELSDLVSPAKLHYELLSKGSVQEHTVTPSIHDCGSGGRGVPIPFLNAVDTRNCGAFSPKGNGIHTTMNNLPSKSSSNDWCVSFGGNSTTIEQKQKFKRLHKYGDHPRRRPPEGEDPNFAAAANLERSLMRGRPLLANCERDGKKQRAKARIFIEEEAEVSSEVAVSVDEEDELDYNSCDDSFIDDGIEVASASTQAEASKINMMTIYRRSLLSQPVIERLPSFCAHSSPDSVVSKPQTIGGENLSENTPYSLQTRPHSGSESIKRDSESFLFDSVGISLEAEQCTSNGISAVKESKLECRKRKLFHQPACVPVVNLEQEFHFQSGPAGENSSLQVQEKNTKRNGHVFDDDEQFYEGIDFDAVEEQAARSLRSKTELSIQNKSLYSEPVFQGNGILDSPSFDLGI